MSECGDSTPASGVTTPTTRSRIEALSRDELVQRCKSLLSIAHKAKLAKDEAAKEAAAFREKVLSNEASLQKLQANFKTVNSEKGELVKEVARLEQELAAGSAERLSLRGELDRQSTLTSGLERAGRRLEADNEALLTRLEAADEARRRAESAAAATQEDLLPFKEMADTFKARWREAVEELAAVRGQLEAAEKTADEARSAAELAQQEASGAAEKAAGDSPAETDTPDPADSADAAGARGMPPHVIWQQLQQEREDAARLKTELQEAAERAVALQGKLDELTELRRTDSERCAVLEAAGEEATGRLEALMAREAELQTGLHQLRDENRRLVSEAGGHAAALQQLSADLLQVGREREATLTAERDAAAGRAAETEQAMVALQQGREELQRRNAQLLQEMNTMNEALKERSSAISRLEEQLAAAAQTQTELGEAQGRLESLQAEVETLRKEAEGAQSVQADVIQARERAEALKEGLETLQQEVEAGREAQRELRGVQEKLEALQQELKAAEQAQDELRAARERVEDLQQEVEAAQHTQNELSVVKEKVDTLQKEMEAIETQLKEAQEKEAGLKEELELAHKAQNELNVMQEMTESLRKQAEATEVQLSEAQEKEAVLQQQLKDSEAAQARLKEADVKSSVLQREAAARVEELGGQVEELTTELSAVRGDRDGLRLKLAELEDGAERGMTVAAALETENGTLKAGMADAEEQLAALRQELATLEETKGERDGRIETLETEKNALEGELAKLKNELFIAMAGKDDVVLHCNILQAAAEKAGEKEDELNDRIAELEGENAALKAKTDCLEDENRAASAENGEPVKREAKTEESRLEAQIHRCDAWTETTSSGSRPNGDHTAESETDTLPTEGGEAPEQAVRSAVASALGSSARDAGQTGRPDGTDDTATRSADAGKLSALGSRVMELQQEKEKLAMQLTDLEKQNQELTSRAAALQAETERLQGDSVPNARFSQVEEENRALRSELASETGRLQSALDGLKAEHESLQSQLADLTGGQRTAHDEAQALERDRAALRESLAQLEAEGASLRSEVASLKEAKDTADNQLASLKEEKDMANTRLAALKEEKDRQLAELRQEFETVSARCGELQAAHSASQAQLADSERQAAELTSQVSELQSQLAAAADRASELEQQVTAAGGQREETETELREARSRAEQAEQHRDQLKTQLEELSAERDGLKTQLTETRKEAGSVRSQLTELESERAALQSRLAEAENSTPRPEPAVSRLDLSETQSEALSTSTALSRADDMSRMRDVEDSIEERYHKLRALAVKLKKRVVQLTAQAAVEAEQRQKAQAELSQAAAQLASSKKEAGALRLQAQNLQALQASCDTLQDGMDSLTGQNKELQRELTRAGEQLSQLKQELCESREARETAEARVKALTESQGQLESQLSAAVGERTAAETERSRLEVRHREADTRAERERRDRLQLQQQVDQLELERERRSADGRQLEQLQLSADQLRTDLETAGAQLAEAGRLRQLAEDAQQLAEQQLQLANDELQSEQARTAQLKANLREALGAKAELEAREVTHQQAADALRKDVETLKQEKEALNLALSESARSTTDLSQTQGALRRRAEALESQVASLQAALTAAKDDTDTARREFEQYKVRAKAVLKKAQTARRTEAESEEREALRAKEERIETLQREVEQLRQERLAGDAESDALQEELRRLEERHRKLTEEAGRAEAGWRREFEKTRGELSKTVEQREAAIAALERRLSESGQAGQTEQLQAASARLTAELTQLRAELAERQEEVTALRRAAAAARTHAGHHKQPPSPIDVSSMEREAAEGSENVTPQSAGAPREPELLPLERLLSSADDSASVVSQATELTSTERDRLAAAETELSASRLTEQHLSSLLHESEASNAKLTQLCDALKEEIRRAERSEERQQHLNQMEYLKNVIVKFLTLKEGDERTRLLPVLTTMLKLSRQEVTELTKVANGGETAAKDQGWTGYLHLWSGGPQ